jgi:hypothetical protein
VARTELAKRGLRLLLGLRAQSRSARPPMGLRASRLLYPGNC